MDLRRSYKLRLNKVNLVKDSHKMVKSIKGDAGDDMKVCKLLLDKLDSP